MTIPQFKYLIREEVRRVRENAPSPTKPKNDPVVKPGTPEKPKKRRPLTPPKEAPSTSPKAEGKDCGCNKIEENEKDIVNKITQRFKNKR